MEALLKDTAFYLDILSAYDYTAHQIQLSSLLCSHPLPRPLSTRFIIRPMTHHDIPAAAHLISHAFAEHGLLNRSVFSPLMFKNVNNWIARLRIALCDHCTFVVEDTEFTADPDMENCTCQQHTTESLIPKEKSKQIVSMIVGHDFTSRIVNYSNAPAFFKNAIRGIFNVAGEKRIERIREEENKMLTKAEIEHRAKEAKAKKEKGGKEEEIHPIHRHHLNCKRDPVTDSPRTCPVSGEGLEVWVLATRASHAGFGFAAALSHALLAYAQHHTSYQFVSIEAAHPATERIWANAPISGRVMARMKSQDFEFQDENGSTIYPFANVTYDVCAIDVTLKR